MDKLIWNASPQAVVLSSETYRLNYQASLPRQMQEGPWEQIQYFQRKMPELLVS